MQGYRREKLVENRGMRRLFYSWSATTVSRNGKVARFPRQTRRGGHGQQNIEFVYQKKISGFLSVADCSLNLFIVFHRCLCQFRHSHLYFPSIEYHTESQCNSRFRPKQLTILGAAVLFILIIFAFPFDYY